MFSRNVDWATGCEQQQTVLNFECRAIAKPTHCVVHSRLTSDAAVWKQVEANQLHPRHLIEDFEEANFGEDKDAKTILAANRIPEQNVQSLQSLQSLLM